MTPAGLYILIFRMNIQTILLLFEYSVSYICFLLIELEKMTNGPSYGDQPISLFYFLPLYFSSEQFSTRMARENGNLK